MVMTSQISLDFSESSLNLSSKSSNSLSSTVKNKTSKEVSSAFDNNKSDYKTSNKKDDFKDVLNSKKSSEEYSNKVTDKNTKNSEEDTRLKELKDKIQELKEKSEEDSTNKDEINEIIESLLNSLNNLLGLKDNSNVNQQLNLEIKDMSLETSGSDSLKVLNQLLELLSSENAKSSFDSESLTSMKDLLSHLQGQLSDESKVSDKMKDGLGDIISKLTDMIDDANNNGKKVLTLEEMLNKGYSQDQSSNENENNEMFSGKKETSKEDKFLNSLLDDNKDNSVDNKINLFASRTQNVQGQNTVVRGLTVNKATFTQDLIQDVKYMSTNNLKELTVKVNPGNLGEITIKLIQEDGLMKANLKANSKETTALLSQNLAEIKKELGDQSIKISEVNIDLYNEDTTFFKDGGFGGTLSQEQGRDENKSSSTGASRNSLEIQNDEDIFENNAEIDTTLDFLA
ncbi:flagellar hook-length control protein FliK [Clostridium butyricum]|uniref:flagellar hook-length control protein FliK n=2 Tax=Clostridium butyricum TaxID=1492 RepID=UPI000E477DA5|nr:flagellar hook-length control protein FliK [Clostridium butyricum]MBA8965396.1 flagellar hook-length control protein FliK [Clostridium butyricum]MBA8970047.1 flagellar hook-length control protein FliK [Clostridium butyricum]MBC2427682.1 flagellar hook-length control protein FliK [Clostridium butyricum]NOW38953.1 flagellar hook-length control protein FliK [Clostridium butyricum]QCJ06921.1 flagellar hook-length control protein FliK [Clostridium butyricum]